jgi:hypothetical protein
VRKPLIDERPAQIQKGGDSLLDKSGEEQN